MGLFTLVPCVVESPNHSCQRWLPAQYFLYFAWLLTAVWSKFIPGLFCSTNLGKVRSSGLLDALTNSVESQLVLTKLVLCCFVCWPQRRKKSNQLHRHQTYALGEKPVFSRKLLLYPGLRRPSSPASFGLIFSKIFSFLLWLPYAKGFTTMLSWLLLAKELPDLLEKRILHCQTSTVGQHHVRAWQPTINGNLALLTWQLGGKVDVDVDGWLRVKVTKISPSFRWWAAASRTRKIRKRTVRNIWGSQSCMIFVPAGIRRVDRWRMTAGWFLYLFWESVLADTCGSS